MWLIPVLFSVAVQDGQLAAVVGAVHGADCHAIRDVKGAASPPDGQGVSTRHVETLYARGIKKLGQDVALGPSCGPEPGP